VKRLKFLKKKKKLIFLIKNSKKIFSTKAL